MADLTFGWPPLETGDLIVLRQVVTSVVVAIVMGGGIASAQGVTVEGLLDCGQWVKARSENRATPFEHYLIGLLNGLSLGKGVDFWRADGNMISREAVYLWVDGYCHQHPLEQVVDGAFTLYRERSGWRPSP